MWASLWPFHTFYKVVDVDDTSFSLVYNGLFVETLYDGICKHLNHIVSTYCFQNESILSTNLEETLNEENFMKSLETT